MIGPFHSSSHGITLSIEKDAHSTCSGVARHQELIFAGYDHDVRIWFEIQLRRVNLRYGEHFSQGGVGKVDQAVCVGRWNGGAKVIGCQSSVCWTGWKGYFLESTSFGRHFAHLDGSHPRSDSVDA